MGRHAIEEAVVHRTFPESTLAVVCPAWGQEALQLVLLAFLSNRSPSPKKPQRSLVKNVSSIRPNGL